MIKLPFKYLEYQVNSLIDLPLNHQDEKEVNARYEAIWNLIELSGWTMEEYVIEMFQLKKAN